MTNTTIEERVIIWRFDQAPRQLRSFFPQGRTTDWLAQVPVSLGDHFTDWLFANWFMKYSIADRRETPDGTLIYLGAMSLSEELTKRRKRRVQPVMNPDQMRVKSSSLSRPV